MGVEGPGAGAVGDLVYRFRSMDALLGKRKELERRQIFFARAQALNDPMEGYKDVVWRGDAVLWENLLRHYILALLWVYMRCVLMEVGQFDEPEIPAALTSDDLPTDAFRDLYNEACAAFFTRVGPSSLCEHLALLREPPRREGIRFVLSLVHSDAFAAVISLAVKHGLIDPEAAKTLPTSAAIGAVFRPFTDASQVSGVDFETIALVANRVRESQILAALSQSEDPNASAAMRKATFLTFTFPDRYVEGIVEDLIHPPWRAACFSRTCTNASSWAVYAKEHTGAALVFRPVVENGRSFLPLTGAIGSNHTLGQPSTTIRGAMKGELSPVTYTNRPPEVDFFQSLGRLPRPKLDRAWHRDRAGTPSQMIDAARINDAAWRTAYWESFKSVATTKLEDWKHEQECRIVQPDMLGLYEQDADAVVEYDFSCLAGIVFGLRSGERDKLEVMRIVRAICAQTGRKDFTFQQMRYDASKGCLVVV